MTAAPKLEPCQEKALQEQRDLATEWMEATGHLPHHCEYELHGIVEDAFTAGLRAAPSAGPREALIERCAKIADDVAAERLSEWRASAGKVAARIRALTLSKEGRTNQ